MRHTLCPVGRVTCIPTCILRPVHTARSIVLLFNNCLQNLVKFRVPFLFLCNLLLCLSWCLRRYWTCDSLIWRFWTRSDWLMLIRRLRLGDGRHGRHVVHVGAGGTQDLCARTRLTLIDKFRGNVSFSCVWQHRDWHGGDLPARGIDSNVGVGHSWLLFLLSICILCQERVVYRLYDRLKMFLIFQYTRW